MQVKPQCNTIDQHIRSRACVSPLHSGPSAPPPALTRPCAAPVQKNAGPAPTTCLSRATGDSQTCRRKWRRWLACRKIGATTTPHKTDCRRLRLTSASEPTRARQAWTPAPRSRLSNWLPPTARGAGHPLQSFPTGFPPPAYGRNASGGGGCSCPPRWSITHTSTRYAMPSPADMAPVTMAVP